ncbi:MAG: CHASE domain-containing protein [Desulfuromonadaceae bacterium]
MSLSTSTKELGNRALRVLPFFVIAVGLALTWTLSTEFNRRDTDVEHEEFKQRVSGVIAGLERRLAANEHILRGVAGLFSSSESVSRDEFCRYVTGLDITRDYPGIQRVGFAGLVQAADKRDHVAAIRAQGFPGYEIKPAGERGAYAPIIYFEPCNWRNRAAFGYDMFSEPIRQKAMIAAHDEGRSIMSGKVMLAQETDQDAQAGVIIYMPIYRHGAATATVDQRRKALLGWAYTALRIRNLVDNYLDVEHGVLKKQLSIRIFSGETEAPEGLIYESQTPMKKGPGHLNVIGRINIAGSRWTYHIDSLLTYPAARASRDRGRRILFSGISATLLLSLFSYALARSHRITSTALQEATQANRSLAEREELLRTIYDNSSVAIFMINIEGIILHANQRAAEKFGYPLEELIGTECFELMSKDDRKSARRLFEKVTAGKESGFSIDLPFFRKDRSEFLGGVTGRPFYDSDGNIIGIVGVIADITERRKAEAAMRLAKTVFEISHSGIMVTDADKTIISVNPAFSFITGYTPEDVLGQKPNLLSSGRQNAEFYARMWRDIKDTGYWEGELWNKRKNGRLFPEMLSISRVNNGNGEVVNYVGIFSDITGRRKAEERILHLAHHDHLTGLPNRACLFERGMHELALAQRYKHCMAVLFIDLDRFKPINDNYGHDAGDAVLRIIAHRLRNLVRATDTVCRQGGDEFVILIPDFHLNTSLGELARKLLSSIEQPCLVKGMKLTVSASIGIAAYPEHGDTFDSILQKADTAMYEAKTNSDAPICFARN